MRSTATYDEIRCALSYFWEVSDDLRIQYINKLATFCGNTQSGVVLELLKECEDLFNYRIGNMWRTEWDEWVYGRHSYVYIMRQFMCGEDAEDTAKVEQRKIGVILEDYRMLNKVAQFPAFTGTYTEGMHLELIKMTNAFVNDTSDEYQRLCSKAKRIGEVGCLISTSFIYLVESVLKVVLSATARLPQLLQAKEGSITKAPTPSEPVSKLCGYSIIFNPVTGYVEILFKGGSRSFTLHGATPAEIAQAVLGTLQSIEYEDIETQNIRRELEQNINAFL